MLALIHLRRSLVDPDAERHPLVSHRGSYIGDYPVRLHDFIRDATENECRVFEQLADRVGTRPGPGGVGRLLNGWFAEF